jgi:hypothetical protein
MVQPFAPTTFGKSALQASPSGSVGHGAGLLVGLHLAPRVLVDGRHVLQAGAPLCGVTRPMVHSRDTGRRCAVAAGFRSCNARGG